MGFIQNFLGIITNEITYYLLTNLCHRPKKFLNTLITLGLTSRINAQDKVGV